MLRRLLKCLSRPSATLLRLSPLLKERFAAAVGIPQQQTEHLGSSRFYGWERRNGRFKAAGCVVSAFTG